MTARTFAQYPDHKILEHCRCITLDELLSRGANAKNTAFKRLAGFINTAKVYDCGAHLLEWTDGILVLVVSRHASELSQIKRGNYSGL